MNYDEIQFCVELYTLKFEPLTSSKNEQKLENICHANLIEIDLWKH